MIYAQTDAEQKARVAVIDASYPPGDVRRYGAKCDGEHDDTDAIQAAVNRVGTPSFPPGVYRISHAINLCDEP